jgi:flagellar basal-body rod modification protein FlgD
MGVISAINAGATSGSAETTESQSTLDKDDFLQLLVTKLTHQDPLNPMEDEAFVAELAQFSSLEQLQNLNNLLTSSLDYDYLQTQTINNTMATSLIGRTITASYDSVYLDASNSPTIKFDNSEYARSITVKIYDANGNLARTLNMNNVAAGPSSIKWDGKGEDGERLSPGTYTVQLSAVDAAGNSFTPSTYIQAEVTGVIYRDGAAYLQADGLEISLGDIMAVGA